MFASDSLELNTKEINLTRACILYFCYKAISMENTLQVLENIFLADEFYPEIWLLI